MPSPPSRPSPSPAPCRRSAAKLRKHAFCALSDDPRLAQQYVAVNHSPNTGASSWRATQTATPFLSPGFHRPVDNVDDSTSGGWGSGASQGSFGSPQTPNWAENSGYVSPRIVSTPHTITADMGEDNGDYEGPRPRRDSSDAVALCKQGSGGSGKGEVKEQSRPEKLSMSQLGKGDQQPVEPTPLIAATPEERRRGLQEMTFTPSRFGSGTAR